MSRAAAPKAIWLTWCSEQGQWMHGHDFTACDAAEHTTICITQDDVCRLLNAMSDTYTGLRDGDAFVMDSLAKAFEEVTATTIEDH